MTAKTPLAVVSWQVGTLSETFVKRHMQELLPGRTCVISNLVDPPTGGHWKIASDALFMNQLRPSGTLAKVFRKTKYTDEEKRKIAKRFLKAQGVEVMMCEYLDFALRWIWPARQLGIRFFAHAHGYDVSVRLRDPEWRKKYLRLRKADGIIAVSHASRAQLIQIGLEAEKIHVVPCGAPVGEPPGEKEVSESTIRCLCVGRMVPKKAPLLMLDAFRRAVQKCPRLRLDYVGAGDLFYIARQFVKALDLEAVVTLHGGQPPQFVHDLMKTADIYVQHCITDPASGDEEGLPVSMLEAGAHGLPVVSTRHAGIPEAVEDGASGFLVEEGDSAAMAERIVTLAENPALRVRMGREGYRRVREKFSWEQERSSLLKILGL